MKNSKTLEILFVEDHLPDAHLVRRILNKTGLDFNLKIIFDGESALEYLKTNIPDVMFIDINLPKVNGLEIVAETTSDSRLRNIPTAILTTSEAGIYQKMSKGLGIDFYLLKPLKVFDIYQFFSAKQLITI